MKENELTTKNKWQTNYKDNEQSTTDKGHRTNDNEFINNLGGIMEKL